MLNACNPQPETRFCIAIEEGEAWLPGDIPAIETAYPNAKNAILTTYRNDSICGTRELLADAVFEGGARALSKKAGNLLASKNPDGPRRLAHTWMWTVTNPPAFAISKAKSVNWLTRDFNVPDNP